MLDDVKVFQPHRGEESVWSASGSRRDEVWYPASAMRPSYRLLVSGEACQNSWRQHTDDDRPEKAVDDPRLPSGGDVGQGGLHDRAPVLPLHATVARREDVKGGDGERIAGFDVRGGRRGDRAAVRPGGRAVANDAGSNTPRSSAPGTESTTSMTCLGTNAAHSLGQFRSLGCGWPPQRLARLADVVTQHPGT